MLSLICSFFSLTIEKFTVYEPIEVFGRRGFRFVIGGTRKLAAGKF